MPKKPVAPEPPAMARQRLDKWLVYARFVKTRGVALDLVAGGRVRINGERVSRPDRQVATGDTLTLALPHATVVVRVAGFAEKRGPAPEAQRLYEVVAPA